MSFLASSTMCPANSRCYEMIEGKKGMEKKEKKKGGREDEPLSELRVFM